MNDHDVSVHGVSISFEIEFRLTWHFWQLAYFRIFYAIDEEYTRVCSHNSNARPRIRCKDFGVDDFGIFCFLSHAEGVLILTKHIVNYYQTIILHTQQLLSV